MKSVHLRSNILSLLALSARLGTCSQAPPFPPPDPTTPSQISFSSFEMTLPFAYRQCLTQWTGRGWPTDGSMVLGKVYISLMILRKKKAYRGPFQMQKSS